MNSKIKAFIIRADEQANSSFLTLFLKSPDFDTRSLKYICKLLNVSSSGNKQLIINNIIQESFKRPFETFEQIINGLIFRPKNWIAIEMAKTQVSTVKQIKNPVELLEHKGDETWYGPIFDQDYEDVFWLIRPIFIQHHERVQGVDENGKPTVNYLPVTIRWLCFARVNQKVITLHWRGFSHLDEVQEDKSQRTSQLSYWQYIPNLFNELADLLKTTFQPITLQGLVMERLWNQYRLNGQYNWHDTRIRAESGGVSLNARSANPSAVDIDVKGINKLAQTIRKSIDFELRQKFKIEIPSVEYFDEVILQTLIQDFGALSYEFELTKKDKGEKIFNGHIYFGSKPDLPSSDSFAHINLHTTFRDSIEQLEFLIEHLIPYYEKRNQSNQPSLL